MASAPVVAVASMPVDASLALTLEERRFNAFRTFRRTRDLLDQNGVNIEVAPTDKALDFCVNLIDYPRLEDLMRPFCREGSNIRIYYEFPNLSFAWRAGAAIKADETFMRDAEILRVILDRLFCSSPEARRSLRRDDLLGLPGPIGYAPDQRIWLDGTLSAAEVGERIIANVLAFLKARNGKLEALRWDFTDLTQNVGGDGGLSAGRYIIWAVDFKSLSVEATPLPATARAVCGLKRGPELCVAPGVVSDPANGSFRIKALRNQQGNNI